MATVNQDDPTTGQNPKHVGTRILNGMPTPSPEPPTESDKQADVMRNEILGTESSPEPQPKDHAIPSVEGNNKNNDAKTPGDDNDDGDGASDDTSDSEDEKKPQSEEVKQAVKSILRTKKDDFWAILGVPEGSAGSIETVNAFKRLGCMLHPEYTAGTKKAFKKLMKLGKANLNQVPLDQVKRWDGDEDLQEQDDNPDPMDIVSEPPPPRVLQIYDAATPFMLALQRDPANSEALREIRKVLNGKIREDNKQQGIAEDTWVIEDVPFTSQYNWASKGYEDLERYPDEDEPLQRLRSVKEALDEMVRKHHYPENWSIPADFAGTAKVEAEYRKKTRDEAAKLVETAKQKAAAEAAKVAEQAKNVDTGAKGAPRNGEVAPTARITYPWPTRKMDDGTLILGLRRRGKIGHQVCVEVEDNGRITRMLKTGSEVGLLDVQLYKGDSEDDWKNLAKCDWSHEDRGDFEELLWVATSKRRSLYSNSRDPNADCCVKFKKGGIQMGCVSKFVKLLGPTSAKQMIEKVCRRDGVAPPWEAEIVTQSNDPRTERRRTRQSRIDKAVKSSAPQEAEVTEDPAVESSAPQDADGPEDLRNKVGKLETDMGDISTMVASLLDLVKRLSSNTAGS